MDRGAWTVTVHGVAKSWTGLRDSQFHFRSLFITVFPVKATSHVVSEIVYAATKPSKAFIAFFFEQQKPQPTLKTPYSNTWIQLSPSSPDKVY